MSKKQNIIVIVLLSIILICGSISVILNLEFYQISDKIMTFDKRMEFEYEYINPLIYSIVENKEINNLERFYIEVKLELTVWEILYIIIHRDFSEITYTWINAKL